MNRPIMQKLRIRSKKYRYGAKGQSCIRCGKNDGTTVPAHYTGQRSHLYGKGTGIKCHDVMIADLCMTCHLWFDNPVTMSMFKNEYDLLAHKTEVSEEFLHCVALTIIRRCKQGILYTDDMSLGGASQ